MTFWKSMAGMIEVELISAEPEAALSAISAAGVALFAVHHDKDLVCSFCVLRRDYDALVKLCEKRGESLRILKKRGLYYSISYLGRRKMLLFGISVILFSAFYLPTRILFVRVEGNSSIPANRILSAAEYSGIHFGVSRRHVRSEKVKNALLDAVPQLQWAGVNTSGCTAVISVRERTSKANEQGSSGVSSIVADRDGYILSSVVTQGTAQVQPGQTVKAGQILISGYTECGICIEATQAKGEIIAQTHRELNVITPANYMRRTALTKKIRSYSLRLGKKRIFFCKGSGISDVGCGRMYKEYVFTLPGGFQLPIAICVDSYQSCDLEAGKARQEDALAALEEAARRYLKTQMVAGQIQRELQTVTQSGNVFQLQGSFICTEVIGIEKPEQIGEANVKSNGENR